MTADSNGGMSLFAEACEAISLTPKKTEKLRLMSGYLKSVPAGEAALGALFFTGRPFPRRDERVLGVGGSLLTRLVAEVTGATNDDLARTYRAHGDLGAMAEQLSKTRGVQGGLLLSDVAAVFDRLVQARAQKEKTALLKGLFERATGQELKYIIKIITGDLRIGSKENLVEEAIAAAFGKPLDAVRRANLLSGDIMATLQLAATDQLRAARLRLFAPVGFMLATPADTAEEIPMPPTGMYVEGKYDGIRAQVHKNDRGVKLFSRTLDELTEFPELNAALHALPGEAILDGEILAWRNSRPLPFTELQKRLGAKVTQMNLWSGENVPVKFVAFDLLYRDGELLLDSPLGLRRARLRESFAPFETAQFEIARMRECHSTAEMKESFRSALSAGHEGIVAKLPDSPYRPGRRGKFWFKLKEPLATLDVVITAVEYGHGRRHGVLSDYTFAVRQGQRLLNIGKAYSGLTDAEILHYTDYFLHHVLEDQAFRKIVEPTVVIEVAFNNIQQSNRHESGYALRFPRIVRLRPDKPVADIDTLDRVAELYAVQGQR